MSTTTRTVPYRRKRAGKTNYKKRLELLKSGQNRLVVRRTNKYILLQVVSYHSDGDKVVVGLTSKALDAFGWTHSKKNLSACYLAGLLLAKKASEKKVTSAILDLGLQTPAKGSKLYAALKGAIDGGLQIASSDSVFPSEDRLVGKHVDEKLEADFTKVKEKILKK